MPVNFASELVNPNIWYPTILGVLVVVAGVVLFVGSTYLLLGTNLGAKLGFLVTFTGLAGFMMILTLLWTTSATPLTVLKGRVPQWKVVEVVPDIANAKTAAVRGAATKSNLASTTDASNVKSAVDAALITKVSTPTLEVTANDNRFAKFAQVTDYEVLQTFVVGGSNPSFYKGEFTHATKYAVVQFCATAQQTQTFGLPPLPPECATGADASKGYVVLEYDLGSVRLPPFVAFVISAIAFGLGLLMLHWREKDLAEAKAAAEAAKKPKTAPTPDEPELAKV